VWALGCCFYVLTFLKNCLEEGSNLAITSRTYKIPDDNPYGNGLVKTQDSKARADMTEVILCLSATYSGKPLPPERNVSRRTRKKREFSQAIAAPNSSSSNKNATEGSNQYHHQQTMGGNEEPAKPLKSPSRSSTCATKSYYQGRRNSRRSY
jgi:hypothetical protein